MKKRINLLKANKRFVERQVLFQRIKNTLIVVFFVLLIANIAFYLILLTQQRSISVLVSQKKELVEYFTENKEAEAKFAYFRNKESQLTSNLKQDVNFYPYYNLLKESLDNYSVGAELYSVSIDKTKSTEFTIKFDNYNNLIEFLRFAESDEFLRNFNQISLINFTKNESQLSKNEFRLNFAGKFINLTEIP